MSPDERRRQLQIILDRHNDAARAFRRTSEAIDAAQERLEETGRAVRDGNHALREAVDAMLTANTAALALWTENGGETS